MPVAKFNYTGRKRIKQAHAAVTVKSGGGTFWFNADINLGGYDLDGGALVFVEAYRQTQYARFRFGTVDNIAAPPENQRRLSGVFRVPDGILFRVKVVEPESALVLALADRITPGAESAGKSLLPVMPADLGQQCWSVDFDEEPVLQINERIPPEWRTAAASAEFVALVYPAVLREILNRILRIEEYFRTDENDDWRSLWLRLAAKKFGAGPPPSPEDNDGKIPHDEIENWIDEAVGGFVRGTRAFDNYRRERDDS